MVSSIRYYALRIKWEYKIYSQNGEEPKLFLKEHLEKLRERVAPTKGEDPQRGVENAENLMLLCQELVVPKDFFTVIKRTKDKFDIDCGLSSLFEHQFSPYGVAMTVDLKLPEGIFSGKAETSVRKRATDAHAYVKYLSVFNGFEIEEITKDQASDYLSRNHQNLVKIQASPPAPKISPISTSSISPAIKK